MVSELPVSAEQTRDETGSNASALLMTRPCRPLAHGSKHTFVAGKTSSPAKLNVHSRITACQYSRKLFL